MAITPQQARREMAKSMLPKLCADQRADNSNVMEVQAKLGQAGGTTSGSYSPHCPQCNPRCPHGYPIGTQPWNPAPWYPNVPYWCIYPTSTTTYGIGLTNTSYT